VGNDSLAPVIAGGAVGTAFVIFISLYFNSVVPIISPIVPSFATAPLPRIVMIYNDTQYLGNLTTFGWGRDMLYIKDVSEVFGSTGETTTSLEKGSTLTFLANDYYNDTLHVLPVTVYIYQYPSNDFLGTLEAGDNQTMSVFVVDDTLADGDYYLRINHQNREGDSASYYFKVRIS